VVTQPEFFESIREAMGRGLTQRDVIIFFVLFGVCFFGGFFISWLYRSRFWLRRAFHYSLRRLRGKADGGSFRRELEFPVTILRSEPNLPTERTKTTNISRGGMFIRTDRPYPLRTTFPFRLTLDDASILEGVALVRWVQDQKSVAHPMGMGIEFIDMKEVDKNRLRAFIRRGQQKKKRTLNARGN